MKQTFVAFCALLFSLFSFSTPLLAEDFSVPAKHAIAIEVTSGKILYQQDAETAAPIGSISTLLTAYLVFEAVEEGKLSMETPVAIGDYPYSLTGTVVSNVPLDQRSYTVEELLKATLITSANSAAIALAEKIAGSEPAFVDKMKEKLIEWGISNPRLVNATGLNNEFLGDAIYPGSGKEDENSLSALDVAIIARRLLLDYPQVLDITSQYQLSFHGNSYFSTNQMLKEGTYARAGVDGLKTGTSDTAGASFVATTQQQNMRILTVILDAKDGQDYPDNRFLATNELFDYVYNNFTLTPLVEKGKQYQSSTVQVFNGQAPVANAVASQTLNAIIRKGATLPVSARYTPQKTILDAPIKEKQVLGHLTLVDKDLIGKGFIDNQPSIEMVSESEIPKAIWPISWWNHFIRYVNEKL